ncbi:hypothetical protein LCGC14_1885950 [marine sediment metagenome]|uniref:Restriction endonuclease type IV Mrr domain-containing protein n=1 Tax=marine sediment metagenome TaxID=412755 RepID=A0A0F9IZ88_9ZZZZ
MPESKLEILINELSETQYRSSSPINFENALEEAFKFLGFESKQIGGSGDIDVIAIANIGKEKFSIVIDGKTTNQTGSSDSRISNSRINWQPLKKHKQSHNADYTIVVGPKFPTKGDIMDNAKEFGVVLLKTDQLIELLKSHYDYPFSLRELKDLFTGVVDIGAQLDDISGKSTNRKELIKKLKVIIEEMNFLQSLFEYFTIESLAARPRIIDLEIEIEELQDIINLFNLPFINVVETLPNNMSQYINTVKIKDISNIFSQISNLLIEADTGEQTPPPSSEQETGYSYFREEIKNQSVILYAREENPYKHFCPLIHFKKILDLILDYLRDNTVINRDNIINVLDGTELAPGRPFRGKRSEGYKIKMGLGLLEMKGFIVWTGSRRPIEFTLTEAIEKLETWIHNFGSEGKKKYLRNQINYIKQRLKKVSKWTFDNP